MRIFFPVILLALILKAGEPDPQLLIDNGHYKRARTLVEAAYRAHPNDARANYLMARLQHGFGNLNEAVKYGEAAVRLDSKASAYHRELGEIYADQAEAASIFRQLGLARKCRAEFEAALAIAPKDPDNLYDQMLFFLQAPGVVGGDKNKAVEIANEIVKADPGRGYLALAHIARSGKEEGRVEELYKKAGESNPGNYEARISLATFHLEAKHANPGAAEQHLKAALDLNPDRIEAYRLLAFALVLQDRFDDAGKVISRAEAAVPDDISPSYYAARAMLRSGKELAKAEAYLKKYLAETKEPEPGAPSIALAHWSLGLVYEKEGRKGEARTELETAVRLKPDFEQAKRDLKRVK